MKRYAILIALVLLALVFSVCWAGDIVNGNNQSLGKIGSSKEFEGICG